MDACPRTFAASTSIPQPGATYMWDLPGPFDYPAYDETCEILSAYLGTYYDIEKIRTYAESLLERLFKEKSMLTPDNAGFEKRVRKAQNHTKSTSVPYIPNSEDEELLPSLEALITDLFKEVPVFAEGMRKDLDRRHSTSAPSATNFTDTDDSNESSLPFSYWLTALPKGGGFEVQVIIPRKPEEEKDRPSIAVLGAGADYRVKRAPTLVFDEQLDLIEERQTCIRRLRFLPSSSVANTFKLLRRMAADDKLKELKCTMQGTEAKLMEASIRRIYQSKKPGFRRMEASLLFRNGTLSDLHFKNTLPTHMRPNAPQMFISPIQKINLLIDCALTLQWMHEKRRVHCDVKGNNVLVSLKDAEVEGLIADFDRLAEAGDLCRAIFHPYHDVGADFGIVTPSLDRFAMILTACETMIPEISYRDMIDQTLHRKGGRLHRWCQIMLKRIMEALSTQEGQNQGEYSKIHMIIDNKPEEASKIAREYLQERLKDPSLADKVRVAFSSAIKVISAEEMLFNLLCKAIDNQPQELFLLGSLLQCRETEEIPAGVKIYITEEIKSFNTHEELYMFLARNINRYVDVPRSRSGPTLTLTAEQKEAFVKLLAADNVKTFGGLRSVIFEILKLADPKERNPWLDTLPSDEEILHVLKDAKAALSAP